MSGDIKMDDFGLLPDTFIMPRRSKRPGWIKDFQQRWELEKLRLRTKFWDFFQALACHTPFMIRPRLRAHVSRIPHIAKDLHKTMYTHFAEGNLKPIEGILCESMQANLSSRLRQRRPNTGLRWQLHKYLSSPKLVSYKVAITSHGKDVTRDNRNALVQAVVRIHSLQSLRHTKRVSGRDANNKLFTRYLLVDMQGNELPPEEEGVIPDNATESMEYVVVQRHVRGGKEEPWKIWGMKEESTPEQMKVKLSSKEIPGGG